MGASGDATAPLYNKVTFLRSRWVLALSCSVQSWEGREPARYRQTMRGAMHSSKVEVDLEDDDDGE